MGIREGINQNWSVGIVAACAGLLVASVVFYLNASDTPRPRNGPPHDWFTVDDGKTWFADDARKFPPFDYQGKTAYRCRVWTCDEGKTTFVSHLERYPASVKKKLESLPLQDARDSFEIRMIEVKPPLTGDRGWVDSRSPAGDAIMSPKPTSPGIIPRIVNPE